jgi:hypothetical protein
MKILDIIDFMEPGYERCKKSHKVMYPSLKEARTVFNKLKQKRGKHAAERIYHCSFCNSYHFTHMQNLPDEIHEDVDIIYKTEFKKYIAMNLYLDDFRVPYDSTVFMRDSDYAKLKWKTVQNYDEFVSTIEAFYKETEKLPDIISFDHDLADEHYQTKVEYSNYLEKTGYHCAKWLIDFCQEKSLKLPSYKVHSMNPTGAENIRSLLASFRKFQDAEEAEKLSKDKQ